MTRPLNSKTFEAGERPAVRMVHLGLGAFHRAHQAWYTQRARDDWGIAAFTGRSPLAAQQLSSQDGLYTLVERGPDSDSFEVITSIVEAHDGADLDALCDLLRRPEVAVVTLTVTEAGYHLRPGAAELDTDDAAVKSDAETLRSRRGDVMGGAADLEGLTVRTAPGRLALALAARRAADGWPLAIVSCDNLPANGAATRAAVLGMAGLVDPLLQSWIAENVSFVDSSIDRITPRTTDADRRAVAEATGYEDVSPVITEPFVSWVLAGDFPGGRPAWEQAGAVFVEDLEPFERRKLWLLNGSHSLMAYAASLRGHETVSGALADPVVSGWVEAFWDEAANHLTAPGLDVPAYRAALRERFENPRIVHVLSQIGMDGSLKLGARAVPVFRAERAAGRSGTAALRPLAAWMDSVCHQVAAGTEVKDPRAARIGEIAVGEASPDQTRALLGLVDESLASEDDVVAAVHALRGTFGD